MSDMKFPRNLVIGEVRSDAVFLLFELRSIISIQNSNGGWLCPIVISINKLGRWCRVEKRLRMIKC